MVSQLLPEDTVSEDVEDIAVDTEPRGVTRPPPPDADPSMAELDMVDEKDEQALVAMARRLKLVRRAAPY